MYKHILIALDGTPGSLQALRQAIALARITEATLTALSVEEKLPAYAASVGEVEEAKCEMDTYFARIQAAAKEQARAEGVTLDTAVRAGHAAQTIVRFADEGGFDLIVVGADGRQGLGGTADRVAERASCSVLIARASPLSLHVRDIMNRGVWTVNPETPLEQVVELLIRRGVKATPVVEEGQVVGIITGGDLLERGGMGLRLSLQRALPDAAAEQIQQLATLRMRAADVMTAPVVTIREDAQVADAIRIMTRQHIKRLPVVDALGLLVGILGRVDVLKLVASVAPEEGPARAQPSRKARTAGDLMSRDVPTTNPTAPLDEVLSKLVATPLRRVVVVDEAGRVMGIILDSDLLAQVGPRGASSRFRELVAWLSQRRGEPPLAGGRAADVMTRPVFTLQAEADLTKVAQEMLEKRVKRLVVVDAEDRLLGMVDRESLLNALSDDL